MFRTLALAMLALCAGLTASAQTASNRKVALVIGNGAYVNAPALANPTRDARLVAGALRQAGFGVVETYNDLGLQPLQTVLRDFSARARTAEAAVIYYAGHGIEANGQNFLIPIDARLTADTDLEFEAVRIDTVLRAVDGARIRIVMLDACRDNPFNRTMRRFAPTRAVTRGLVGVDADDVLVMFAAAPGQTAADGAGANSPFAVAISRFLPQDGLDIRFMAGKVRDDVLRSTQGAQRPFISASITGEALYLTNPPAAGGAPDIGRMPTDSNPAELALWQSASMANTIPAYLDYLQQYPGGRFATQARERLAMLRRPQKAPTAAPIPATPAVRSFVPLQTDWRPDRRRGDMTIFGYKAPEVAERLRPVVGVECQIMTIGDQYLLLKGLCLNALLEPSDPTAPGCLLASGLRPAPQRIAPYVELCAVNGRTVRGCAIMSDGSCGAG